MIARAGSGWQTVLADLSLILFMVTAAAVQDAPAVPPAHSATNSGAPTAPPALADPVAVWRGLDAAELARWLKTQPADPRQRLTIVAPTDAAALALEMARGAGRPARLVIEPDGQGTPYATLTYDQSAGLARALQPASQSQSTGVDR